MVWRLNKKPEQAAFRSKPQAFTNPVSYDIKDGVLTVVPVKRKMVITEEYLIAGLNEQNCHSDLIPDLLSSEYEI